MGYKKEEDLVNLLTDNGFKVISSGLNLGTEGNLQRIELEVRYHASEKERLQEFLDTTVNVGYITTFSLLKWNSIQVQFLPVTFILRFFKSTVRVLEMLQESTAYLQEDKLCLESITAFSVSEKEIRAYYYKTGPSSTQQKTEKFEEISEKISDLTADLTGTDWMKAQIEKNEENTKNWNRVMEFITCIKPS